MKLANINCVAFLFSLTSFCERHRDRETEIGTDTQCILDKSRKKSNPQEIIDIDMRVDQTQVISTAATTNSYDPIGQVQDPQNYLKKKFYELCGGTVALVLQTLHDDTFESDDFDDDNEILPTMADACKNLQHPFDILSFTKNFKKNLILKK